MKGIKIEIKQSLGELATYLSLLWYFIFIGYIMLASESPTTEIIIIGIVLFVPTPTFLIIYDIKPMKIRSNGITLRYRHLWKEHEIALSDITELKCEPYEVRYRYGSYQRIRLTIKLKNTEMSELEFNDVVKSDDLIMEKLNGSTADIPLLRLYEFLKERTNL